MKRVLTVLAAVALAGCYELPSTQENTLAQFSVQVLGVIDPGTGLAAQAVTTCEARFPTGIPPGRAGDPDCPYEIPRGDLDFRIRVAAFDSNGAPMTGLTRPVSFNVVPGDLAADYGVRWGMLTNGVGDFTVRANHVFGEVRVWVQDAPPQALFNGAGAEQTEGRPDEAALEFPRTFATGISEVEYFQDPTLQKLQQPEGTDVRSSPFVGQFVALGRPPTAGPQILHNCDADPDNNGQPLQMVVTGIDPSGFFITDITSCRIPEFVPGTTFNEPVPMIPEPDGFFPGTYGSIYVYNYSHPDGLDVGDLLWAISGSMQEFTSTTQLTFPAWNIAEKVRLLPPDQWNKWLDLVPITDINLRRCLLGTTPTLTDSLCAGQSNRTLKLESVESGLVRLTNVKMPTAFPVCDRDGNNEVEFFCAYTDDNDQRQWGICPFGPTSEADTPALAEEIQCYIDCTNSQGEYSRTVCSEGTSFNTFGQLTVEMNGPGPAAAGLDETVGRIQTLETELTADRTTGTYTQDSQLRIFCDGAVHYRLGSGTVVATTEDPVLAANTLIEPFLDAGQTHVSVLSQAGTAVACKVARNTRTRILTVLKDVAPDLNVNCNPNDADLEAALQCQYFQGARYDIVGHLRQVQPARPRWMVMPRDLDDVCCRPGEGLQCPNPIPQCES